MRAKFGSTKDFKQAYSLPPVGNFALEVEPPKTPHWDHCREQFASKFNESISGFFYSIHPNTAEDVAEFLAKCEEVIGLTETSLFAKTEKPTILWVVPSSFWVGCDMKRSFLTMMLRCGLNFDAKKDNFDEALFSETFKENKWARETRAATLRFLFGFTSYQGPPRDTTTYMSSKHGWHEEFSKLDNLSIRKKLALPEGEVRETTVIGVESLWA
jgi:hypothetical protein